MGRNIKHRLKDLYQFFWVVFDYIKVKYGRIRIGEKTRIHPAPKVEEFQPNA